jgi:hypothetical protein
MYRDSFKGLYRLDYLKGVDDFINFVFYKPKNIS